MSARASDAHAAEVDELARALAEVSAELGRIADELDEAGDAGRFVLTPDLDAWGARLDGCSQTLDVIAGRIGLLADVREGASHEE